MSVAHAVGDRVQVRRAYPPGHTRAPYFMRGKVGIVADTAGVYRNPEELAYGIYDGARLRVYRVRFRQVDLWAHYRGSPHDTVYVDIYENWLERVTEAP
ncbi:MAG: SH3-like domain-containing protein [Rhodospirillaceae bacterium]